MPQVGKKKFAYTQAGKKKAKIYAKKSKQKVKKGQIMIRFSAGTNVKGDWKTEAMKKAKQHIKTGKKFITTGSMSAAKTYGSYVAPTVGLFKGASNIATGIGKLALRNPALTIAASVLQGSKKAKWDKANKWFDSPMTGRKLKHNGKWMV